MRHSFIPLLVLVLAGAAGAQTMAVRQAPPPPKLTLAGDSVVVAMRDEGRSPLIEATIDGRGPYTFLLDTGARGSVISKAFADSFGLRVVGQARVGSPVAGGTPREASLIEIDRMAVGGAQLEKISAVAMDLSTVGLGAGGSSPVGVLSPAMFAGALVTLDFAGHRLVLRRGALPAPDGRDVFGWDSTARLPQVPVDLPGGRQDVHVDTGSPAGLSLPSSWAARLPLAAKPESAGVARTIDHTFVRRKARLNGTVSIGRHTFANPELTFADEIVVGSVGMEWLRRFRLTLDPASRRIRLDPNPATPAAAERPGR